MNKINKISILASSFLVMESCSLIHTHPIMYSSIAVNLISLVEVKHIYINDKEMSLAHFNKKKDKKSTKHNRSSSCLKSNETKD